MSHTSYCNATAQGCTTYVVGRPVEFAVICILMALMVLYIWVMFVIPYWLRFMGQDSK